MLGVLIVLVLRLRGQLWLAVWLLLWVLLHWRLTVWGWCRGIGCRGEYAGISAAGCCNCVKVLSWSIHWCCSSCGVCRAEAATGVDLGTSTSARAESRKCRKSL